MFVNHYLFYDKISEIVNNKMSPIRFLILMCLRYEFKVFCDYDSVKQNKMLRMRENNACLQYPEICLAPLIFFCIYCTVQVDKKISSVVFSSLFQWDNTGFLPGYKEEGPHGMHITEVLRKVIFFFKFCSVPK